MPRRPTAPGPIRFDPGSFDPGPFDVDGYDVEPFDPGRFEPDSIGSVTVDGRPPDAERIEAGLVGTSAPVLVRARPEAGPARDASQLAGPDALGRNLVVGSGGSAPPPWDGALWITIDERVLADPGSLLDALRPRWHARERMVFELAVDLQPAGAVAAGTPLWELAVTTLPDHEVLHHLVWANSVDGRTPLRARWAWAERAVELGAAPTPEEMAGDVMLGDGRPAWCDGGPLRHPDDLGPEQLGAAVLHRFGLEAGSLRPLGANAAAGTAAVLAADQRAAVTHPAGAARIIAPAGSGKTRVLTERARLLLDGWQLPDGGLCLVAFNRRAADEMVGRTADLPRLHVRTLNALGLAILDGRPPFRRRAGGRHDVLDERAVRRLLDGLVATLPPASGQHRPDGPLDRRPLRRAAGPARPRRRRGRPRRRGRRPRRGAASATGPAWPSATSSTSTSRSSAPSRCSWPSRDDPPAPPSAACRLLLVDEFQDLTPAHLLLIRLLAAPDLAVFGVGDDDQTIYGYTGATPDWLIRYAELFPGAGVHALEVNYRCPAAGRGRGRPAARHNRRRVAKVIRARPRRRARRRRRSRRAPRRRGGRRRRGGHRRRGGRGARRRRLAG